MNLSESILIDHMLDSLKTHFMKLVCCRFKYVNLFHSQAIINTLIPIGSFFSCMKDEPLSFNSLLPPGAFIVYTTNHCSAPEATHRHHDQRHCYRIPHD